MADDTTTPPPGWAIALIEPNRDFEADRALRRHGFRVVFLTYRKLLTGHNRPGWRKATDFIPRPLFPGYIFLELWPDEPWPVPSRTPGYAGLLDNGKRRLSEDLVMSWKQRIDEGEFDDKPPSIAANILGRFHQATDPDARRQLLEARFAEMVRRDYAINA